MIFAVHKDHGFFIFDSIFMEENQMKLSTRKTLPTIINGGHYADSALHSRFRHPRR